MVSAQDKHIYVVVIVGVGVVIVVVVVDVAPVLVVVVVVAVTGVAFSGSIRRFRTPVPVKPDILRPNTRRTPPPLWLSTGWPR